MGKIKQLPMEVVNMIAAGEVVERPASVVKELLENSLDAGAKNIVIKLQNGGIDLIEISDDGEGMDKDDAVMAFTQHATSKLRSAADLERILTLGFRGEALASISAVADIELETKREEGEATRVRIQNQVLEVLPSARAQTGTRLAIKKLFQSVPARRKFLRTAQTELNHVTNTFIATSLMHLNVRFELYHGPKLVHRLPAVEKIGQRVYDIWPKLEPQHFYHLEPDKEEPNKPKTALELYIGKPDIAQKGRKQQLIFINGRPISDRLIQKAIGDAYKGFIHRDLQPVYFINLTLPPAQVDVNVHPRKQEVKFASPGQIYSLIQRNTRNLLTQQTKSDILERTFIKPDQDAVVTEEAPEHPFTQSLKEENKQYQPTKFDFSRPSLIKKPSKKAKVQASMDFSRLIVKKDLPNFNFKPLQIFNTYIVYERNESVIFIDQHAAAEKILYEKLMRAMDENKGSIKQPLLVPEIIELPLADKQKILSRSDPFNQLGLEISDFGGQSIQITAKPSATLNLNVQDFMESLIADEENYDSNDQLMAEISNPSLHNLIASAACHGSVRAGQRLSEPEMRQIVEDLRDCKYPYNCPHGRPVSWSMPKYDLEKQFKRVI